MSGSVVVDTVVSGWENRAIGLRSSGLPGVGGVVSGLLYWRLGEGGVDYTFLACGAPFQMQLEAPPYQFEYERKWFAEHDSGINHICWIVPNALETVEHLESNGATVAMPYEEFGGTYNGFVAIDPEGRWVEIMEYVGGFKTPDVEFYPVGHVGLQTLGVVQLCRDLNSQVEWYTDVMGQKIIHDARSDNDGLVYLADHTYDGRQCVSVLATPSNDAETALMDKHGPVISSVLYQAGDVDAAYADAVAAGSPRSLLPLTTIALESRPVICTSQAATSYRSANVWLPERAARSSS